MTRKLLCALIGALLLLTSPVAWGCDTTDMAACQMSACPMSGAGSTIPGCHEPASDSQDRGALAPARTACCDAPLEREPVDSTVSLQLERPSSQLVTEGPVSASREPLDPPASCEATIASQKHRLGHYTLLSSFLI